MSPCWWLTNSSLASFFKHTTVVCSKLKPRDQASLAQILMLTLQNQSAFLKAFQNSFMTEALHCLPAVSDVPYKYVISQWKGLTYRSKPVCPEHSYGVCMEINIWRDLILVFFFPSLLVDLLGLLKWRSNTNLLQQNLKQLMKVDGGEVVKVTS